MWKAPENPKLIIEDTMRLLDSPIPSNVDWEVFSETVIRQRGLEHGASLRSFSGIVVNSVFHSACDKGLIKRRARD